MAAARGWILPGLLLAGAAALSSVAFAQTPPIFLKSSRVCSDGVPHQGALDDTRPRGIPIWGTACPTGSNDTSLSNTGISTAFAAPGVLRIFVSGYPSAPGNYLRLERVSDRAQLTLRPLEDPGLFWQPCEFSIPFDWRGQPVRFAVEQSSGTPGNFFGFTTAESSHSAHSGNEALTLLLRTIGSWLFIFLPGYALAFLLIGRGYKNPVTLGCTVLAGIAGAGYLSFWAWFFSPVAGQVMEIGLASVCLASVVFGLRRSDASARWLLRRLLVPGALTGAVALLVLSAGFLYGGLDSPFDTAATRFSDRLPADNQLPYLFSTALARANVPKPMAGEWLSSDRPPLQTGIYLAQYTLSRGRLGYTVVGVLCECLWVFALWLFLQSLRLDRSLMRLALIVCIFSGFTLLNSFYVWPKLLAAAYVLAFAIFFMSARFRSELVSAPTALLAGALLAFAMLAHGGSMFAVIGLLCTALPRREFIGWRSLVFLAAAAACLYAPWMAYQRFFDPPGNHLLKMHLAGIAGVDSRSVLQALRDAYRPLDFRTWALGRLSNAGAVIGQQTSYWQELLGFCQQAGQRGSAQRVAAHEAAAALRVQNFFYFLPCLGPLMFGPLALLMGVGPKRWNRDTRIAAHLCAFIGATLAVWCVLMFTPGSAVLHQGSYAVVLLAYGGSLLAVWAVSPRMAMLLGGAQVALNALLYVAYMRPPELPGLLQSGVLRYATACLALCSSGAVVFLLQLRLLDFREPGEGEAERCDQQMPLDRKF